MVAHVPKLFSVRYLLRYTYIYHENVTSTLDVGTSTTEYAQIKNKNSVKKYVLLKQTYLPWFSDDFIYFLEQLFRIKTVVINLQSQAKIFHLSCIEKLVCKQRKSHYRDPMIC